MSDTDKHENDGELTDGVIGTGSQRSLARAEAPSRLVLGTISTLLVVLVGALVLVRPWAQPEPPPSQAQSAANAEVKDPAVEALAVEQPETGPRRLGGETDMEMFALLPGEGGIIQVRDGALWHRTLDSSETRKLHEGPVYRPHATHDGSVFFATVEDGQLQVWHSPSLEEKPKMIPSFPGGLFCPLPGRGSVASFIQGSYEVELIPIDGDPDDRGGVIPAKGDYRWVTDVACDDVHGRVALLTVRDNDRWISVISLSEGETKTIVMPAKEIKSLRFDETGDALYYLIDRGPGYALERLDVEQQAPVPVLPDTGSEVTAYSLAPDGQIAYIDRDQPQTSFRLLGADDRALDEPSRVSSISAMAGASELSPSEQTLAYVEIGRDDVDKVKLFDVESFEHHRLLLESRDLGSAEGSLAWSPDETQLAYVTRADGVAQVWTVKVDGGQPVMVPDAAISQRMNMIWAPLDEIVYQRPGITNYMVFDPHTTSTRPLFAQERGYSLNIQSSHDGEMIVVYWNRSEGGLVITDIEGEHQRGVNPEPLWPIAWSADDRYIYAYDQTAPKKDHILRVPATGGEAELWREFDLGPHPDADCSVVFKNGDLLCQTTQWQRDLWLLEDPGDSGI